MGGEVMRGNSRIRARRYVMGVHSSASRRRALDTLPLTVMRARVFLAAFLIATPLCAQAPRESLIVSPAWLAAHLGDQNLVILHVGARAQYDSAHVPGARFVSLDDISVS